MDHMLQQINQRLNKSQPNLKHRVLSGANQKEGKPPIQGAAPFWLVLKGNQKAGKQTTFFGGGGPEQGHTRVAG